MTHRKKEQSLGQTTGSLHLAWVGTVNFETGFPLNTLTRKVGPAV
jgi:hypothetical protein